MSLVAASLLVSSSIEMYLSYQETKTNLARIQKEEARVAVSVIRQFISNIESQIGWTTHSSFMSGKAGLEERRVDYMRLLRQEPAITEIRLLDSSGIERLTVSRLSLDRFESGLDHSQRPEFTVARIKQRYYGSVYFRKGSEPYMTIAISEGPGDARITAAEVSLKFIWDEISRIKVGETGHAYVVDSHGLLIAHPDISLVLRKTGLNSLPQIKKTFERVQTTLDPTDEESVSRDADGRKVLIAYATIDELGWIVFVELDLSEAFAPLYASMRRTVMLLAVGLVLSLVASLIVARRMVIPIRLLQLGAARIGRGEFSRKIEVETGDELEALAAQINTMADDLRERELIRDMFGKFVPESVASAIVQDEGALKPQTRVATILFTDIVGFSSIAESISPERVVQMLNEYFSTVVGPIERNGGVIEQFQGDAILATFNMPIEDPDHAANAIRAALEIQRVLTARTFDLDTHGQGVSLETRVGINTGVVVGGTVGSGDRLGYTVHGDAVNVAARIEQLNKQYETRVLVSHSTVELVGSEFGFTAVGKVPIRGRHQPVTLYRVESQQRCRSDPRARREDSHHSESLDGRHESPRAQNN